MGSYNSKVYDIEVNNELDKYFDSFIKLNCNENPSDFVNASTLVSLFACYLQLIVPELYKKDTSTVLLVMDNINKLCLRRGYIISCGIEPLNYCIIGLSILRFQK